MLSRIHYISQGATLEEQEKDIREAFEAGCKLVQVRFKNGTGEEILQLAQKAKTWSQLHDAKLIINDWVEIAKEADADGVHLGLTDTSVEEARKMLGPNKVIGGTANTAEDVLQRIREKCDYVGLGPFRFTTTKEKLSPILGLEGYQRIISELTNKQLSIPIYAIGGIELNDLEALKSAGIYGIAVSGMIANAADKRTVVSEIDQILNYV